MPPSEPSPNPHRLHISGSADSPPAPHSRIRLISTTDPHTRLRPGDQGTVTDIDPTGTVMVRWDSGSTLGMLPGIDEFDILPGHHHAQGQPSPLPDN